MERLRNKKKISKQFKKKEEENTSRVCVSLIKMIWQVVSRRNEMDKYKKTKIIGYLYFISSVLEQDTSVWCE